MKGIYRKTGWTFRLESAAGTEAWIVLSESGVAETDVGGFSSRCTAEAPAPRPHGSRVRFLARGLSNDISRDVLISRMTVTEGRAEHRVESDEGKKQWSETFGRIYLEIASGPLRMTIDRGGPSLAATDVSEFSTLSQALARSTPLPSKRIADLRLSHAVTAQTIRGIADAAALPKFPERLRLRQIPHEQYSFDGWGQSIKAMVLSSGGDDASRLLSSYRPTYRLPPIATPFHVRLEGPYDHAEWDLRAVELLHPFVITPDRLLAGVLCVDAEQRSFSCLLSIELGSLLNSVRSVSEDYHWFPLSAGAWGSEIDLKAVELRPWP